MSKSTIRSTSNIIEYFKWKYARFILQMKQNKLLKYYDNKHYQKIPLLFRSQKDYEQITFDEFPFLYLMISTPSSQLGQNNVEAMRKFLEKYQHKSLMFINDQNPLACTPAQYAILENQQDASNLLQEFGGTPHVSNSEGHNAMHLAAIFKRQQAFDLCIKKNIDINHVDLAGNTPFHYACRAGSVEMVSALIAAKAKKIANQLNQYPIHAAIESGKLQCVRLLDNDISRPYPKYHPIHSAARCNNLQVFNHVYQKTDKSLMQKDSHQSTVLHHAVSYLYLIKDRMQDNQIVKFICNRLPKNRAQVLDAKDSFGNTPLHLAFINSNVEIIRELVSRKSSLNVKNRDDMTPVDYGMTSDNFEVKRYLMDLEGWKHHHEKKY